MKKLIYIIFVMLVSAILVNTQDQSVKTSAAQHLAAAIENQGLDTALQMFAKLRKNPGDYDINEREFNALGNRFLSENKIRIAVAIFKLNVRMFPESVNTYYSLAKACMYFGDKECAEQNFKLVLKKNPNQLITLILY